jgi:hypothetical protein
MLCARCETRVEQVQRAIDRRGSWTGPGSERLRRVLCHGCGAVLPTPDAGESLLQKLSQLARFGLVAEATLLAPAPAPSRRDA